MRKIRLLWREFRSYAKVKDKDLTPFIHTQRALCATCKHDVWSYEKEYRLFLYRSRPDGRSKLLPGDKPYQFSAKSLTSIIFGCRASDECISFVKSITNDRPDIKCYRACQEPNQFGVNVRKIVKL